MSSQLAAVRQFMSVRGRAAPRAEPTTPVVVVGAGKGGVGTSTVAMLLASAMSAEREVLLVDTGHQLGVVHHMLGVDPAHTLDDLRAGRAEPEQLLVPVAPGLTLLSAHSPPTAEPLSVAERKLLFRRATALYERYALIVVDAGATVDSIVTSCVDGTVRFLAVTASDRIAVVSTYALIKLLHIRCPNVTVEVLANRCEDDVAARTIESITAACEQFLGRPVDFAGAVPVDPNFTDALSAGIGAVDAAAGSPAADALHRIGMRIAPGAAPVPAVTLRAGGTVRTSTPRA
jgi:flagellar biosynthesis protein FlhG